MGYNPLLKPIVRSPLLPDLLKELQAIWQDEQKRRQAFYDWVTPDVKAEFIEGEIIVHSPVRNKHNIVLQYIYRLISIYVDIRDLGYIGYEKIMCRLERNDYEPDLVFFKKEKAKAFTDDQTIFPVPDLVVEVLSNTTEERDRGVKFLDYAHNGVQEYWIVDADTQQLEQYLNKEGAFDLHAAFTLRGLLNCPTIDGFEVDIRSFFDKKNHLNTLEMMTKK